MTMPRNEHPDDHGGPRPSLATTSVADWIATLSADLGAREAYGICGREITAVWLALRARLTTRHARHETGAVFAATAAAQVTDCPVVTFSTTAPGLSNAITGLETARAAGVKLLHISPVTSTAERGRLGI